MNFFALLSIYFFVLVLLTPILIIGLYILKILFTNMQGNFSSQGYKNEYSLEKESARLRVWGRRS
jgi:hypothetical protein